MAKMQVPPRIDALPLQRSSSSCALGCVLINEVLLGVDFECMALEQPHSGLPVVFAGTASTGVVNVQHMDVVLAIVEVVLMFKLYVDGCSLAR